MKRDEPRGRYHGGRRPSRYDSLHSPTVIPPSALDKPSIMKRYHCRRTTRWGVTAHSPTMVTLHDTRFIECRWWNDGWSVKTVVTLTVIGLHDTGPRSKSSEPPCSWPSNCWLSITTCGQEGFTARSPRSSLACLLFSSAAPWLVACYLGNE